MTIKIRYERVGTHRTIETRDYKKIDSDKFLNDLVQQPWDLISLEPNPTQSTKVHKAAGPDQIRPRVVKEMSHTISPILTLIYRRSYDTAEVPDDWKKAYVTPVFKKGKKSEPGNYRPI